MSDPKRHRAIVEARRKKIADERAARAAQALDIIVLMREAITEWDTCPDDQAEGIILNSGTLLDRLATFEEAWQKEALSALGSEGKPSESFTREDRQKIIGNRNGLPFPNEDRG
jgi:hypothetical protein